MVGCSDAGDEMETFSGARPKDAQWLRDLFAFVGLCGGAWHPGCRHCVGGRALRWRWGACGPSVLRRDGGGGCAFGGPVGVGMACACGCGAGVKGCRRRDCPLSGWRDRLGDWWRRRGLCRSHLLHDRGALAACVVRTGTATFTELMAQGTCNPVAAECCGMPCRGQTVSGKARTGRSLGHRRGRRGWAIPVNSPRALAMVGSLLSESW